jgi:hypothetical protein
LEKLGKLVNVSSVERSYSCAPFPEGMQDMLKYEDSNWMKPGGNLPAPKSICTVKLPPFLVLVLGLSCIWLVKFVFQSLL